MKIQDAQALRLRYRNCHRVKFICNAAMWAALAAFMTNIIIGWRLPVVIFPFSIWGVCFFVKAVAEKLSRNRRSEMFFLLLYGGACFLIIAAILRVRAYYGF